MRAADAQFRIALGAVFAGLTALRTYYQIQARHSGPAKQFESSLNIVLRAMGGLAGFALLILYLVEPDTLAWASLELPAWLRWLGAVFGAAGVLLLVWVHRELGRNFSGTLHLRVEHTLVTSGPYRWVRHPMYTAFFGVVLSFFLLSANWLIGAIFIGGIAAVMISRVAKEERVMADRFGAEYQAWAARTGRFLPQLRG
ncbi:MAG TPA: isoprenylcysteine carboxylmethyltransferase family protein [Bryobacteraceae bacterium]|nr:isoprenylcysteine carboxylmethyltransferase family protein [Bryobacteraceae bacterium]